MRDLMRMLLLTLVSLSVAYIEFAWLLHALPWMRVQA